MKINSDLFTKAKETESAEELLKLAKDNDIEMTAEEAEDYYNKLRSTAELADDELENVSGGECSDSGIGKSEGYFPFLYQVGDRVVFLEHGPRPDLRLEGEILNCSAGYECHEGEPYYYLKYFKERTTMWGWYSEDEIIRRLY